MFILPRDPRTGWHRRVGRMATPTSARISARLKSVQEHGTPVQVVGASRTRDIAEFGTGLAEERRRGIPGVDGLR